MKGYAKLECKNRININVFGYEDKQFYPIYISKGSNEDVFNLLVITEGEKKNCVLIKDFNKLMYNKTKSRHRKHFGIHCLQCFSTEEMLTKHKVNCIVINGEQAIRMPKKQRIYSSSKITASRCWCLMLSTQIIRQLRRKWKDAS